MKKVRRNGDDGRAAGVRARPPERNGAVQRRAIRVFIAVDVAMARWMGAHVARVVASAVAEKRFKVALARNAHVG